MPKARKAETASKRRDRYVIFDQTSPHGRVTLDTHRLTFDVRGTARIGDLPIKGEMLDALRDHFGIDWDRAVRAVQVLGATV